MPQECWAFIPWASICFINIKQHLYVNHRTQRARNFHCVWCSWRPNADHTLWAQLVLGDDSAWKLPSRKPFPIDYISLLIASKTVSTPIIKCNSWKLNKAVTKEMGWGWVPRQKKKKKMNIQLCRIFSNWGQPKNWKCAVVDKAAYVRKWMGALGMGGGDGEERLLKTLQSWKEGKVA